MRRYFLALAAALAAVPSAAVADPAKTTVASGHDYELAGSDELLLPSALRNQDANGVGIALPRPSNGYWPFEFYESGKLAQFRVHNSSALRANGKEGDLYAYTLPVKTVTVAATTPAAPVHNFRNGISLSNSLNGYIEDSTRFVAPYISTGAIRSLRIPLKSQYLVANGAVLDTVSLNGYSTKEWPVLKADIDLALANDVQVYLDDHEYHWYSDQVVEDFWIPVGQKLMATYGYNDNIVLELQNESGKNYWDPNYAQSVKNLVTKLRAAGITYKLAIGWADWNNVGSANHAFTDLDAIGGPQSIDPLNRIIWTGHFYPTTSGNDQPKAGQNAPQINGSTVSGSFNIFFDACKTRNLQCAVTEIGMGGGARGWLANGTGTPAFDGKAWYAAYSALTDNYKGNLVGTIAWGGGSAWADTYPFKIEYSKDAWSQTPYTDYYTTAKVFWAK